MLLGALDAGALPAGAVLAAVLAHRTSKFYDLWLAYFRGKPAIWAR